MNAVEVIREARNILFERGWLQDDFSLTDEGTGHYIEGAPVCIYGALALAECDVVEMGRASVAEPALAVALLGPDGPAWDPPMLSTWNDEQDRTFSDVVDLLDRAEKIAERELEVSA